MSERRAYGRTHGRGRRRPYRGSRVDRNTEALRAREAAGWTSAATARAARRQPGQVPPGHPDADRPVPWGEHPRDCDCGDCP